MKMPIILNFHPFYIYYMKVSIVLLVAYLAISCLAIPFRDQIALVNSLEVGRDEEPMVWACTGCDSTNKPISSVIIEEP